jgi:hypothetical protein
MRDSEAETKEKARARKSLQVDLNRIIKTARFIAGTVPGFDEPFRLPRSESDAALLYTARLFAERAAPSLDVFIRFSMPANFIDDLNTHIRNIERATDSRAAVRTRQKAATAAIDAAMKKCMKAVLDLDVIVGNTLRDDKITLTLWNSARHVKQATRRKKKAAADRKDSGGAPQAASED